MKKSLVQLAFNSFLHGTSKNPKPRFLVPDPSLFDGVIGELTVNSTEKVNGVCNTCILKYVNM